jgi:hypothetical protein
MDTQWVKLKSWHSLRGPDDYAGPKTRCGRPVPDGTIVVDDLPNEKSCEICLRILEKMREDMEQE